MTAKKRLAFATGSRADYGIMRRYLDLLDKDENIELSILVTGALLDPVYGHQVELIYQDGFHIDAEIRLDLDSSDNAGILHSMAQAMDKFGDYFGKTGYDLLMILGDRYEMLSVAAAAAVQKIPILHIHGGEATYGNYDEFIRHSITKMSIYHFTAAEEYKNRVIQLGESPERVFQLGALGAENCLFLDESHVPQEIKALPEKQYFVILFHPETLTDTDVLWQVRELLSALQCFPKYRLVFLGMNADTHSEMIRSEVYDFVEKQENAVFYENLPTDAYHYALKNAVCLIGNSSSGLIEAPSLGIYTINIGDRQGGRVRGNSVVDIPCKKEDIVKAVEYVLKVYKDIKPVNPYYQPDTAGNYYRKTLELLKRGDSQGIDMAKKFYDLPILESNKNNLKNIVITKER